MKRTLLEDTWGMREYNLQNSVRIITSNPDMMNTNHVNCPCGMEIDRANDWHVMIANGILLCRLCARCNSCRRDCASANKRLICIDGLVLCYLCLGQFGYFLEPTYRIKIDDPKNLLAPPPDNGNNTDAMKECDRKNRCCYMPQRDGRRPIREALYDHPSVKLPDERNPLITAPIYDATRGTLEKMTCPGCSKVAKGAERYVVPSASRVYHRQCFNCQLCKVSMAEGMQVAGKHFQFCTCEQPLAWCTRVKCKLNRLEHHATTKCWLGSLRPGGREQMDTDISGLDKRQADAKKNAPGAKGA